MTGEILYPFPATVFHKKTAWTRHGSPAVPPGGAGLGGVITPTGVGTLVENSPLVRGKVNYDGKDYLVMKPLRADVALIGAYKVDKAGNVWYKGSAQNFNRVMATAADLVIVEAEELVEVGEIEPENVMTPGILVNYIVVREGK